MTRTFNKLYEAFQKLERSQEQVIEKSPEAELTAELDFLQEFFEQFSEVQSRMAELDIDIEISFTEEMPERGPHSTQTSKPAPPPSRRFKKEEAVEEENIPPEAKLLFQALGVNYKVREHCEIFDGSDPLRYIGFRHQWESADRALSRQQFTNFEKFLELKKVVKNQALKLIVHLPNSDESYEIALDLLDQMFLNPQLSINQITAKLNELPKQGTTVTSIRDFHTEVLSLYHSMRSLNMEADYMGSSLFISAVQARLNGATLREWCKLTLRHKCNSPLGHSCTIQDLIDQILFNLQMTESFSSLQTAGTKQIPEKVKPKPSGQQATLPKNFLVQSQGQGETQKVRPCPVCHKTGHSPFKCPDFKNKNSSQRFQIAVDKKLCKLCFLSNHKTKDCKRKEALKCATCSKAHNTLLHLTFNPSQQNKKASVKMILRAQGTFVNGDQPMTIAHLLKAKLITQDGRSKIVTILMDSGSSMNLITRKLAREMRLETLDHQGPRTCELLGGIKKHLQQETVGLELCALYNGYKCKTSASVISFIGRDDTKMNFEQSEYPYLEGYQLTIPLPRQESLDIDLLIGEPCYSALFLGVEAKCSCSNDHDCITLYSCKLGYYLGGSFEPQGLHFLARSTNNLRES